MPRLAWFTPLPPARSGIATYSAEALPHLAGDHEIDVFTDQCTPGGTPAHDFVWKHLCAPYDLVVYQLGNSPAHDYMWPYLTRYPGLIVLHDAELHHARARALLTRGRTAEYREELRFSHPEVPPGVADLVMANLANLLFYHWPMAGVAVRAGRLVAVHSARLRDDLAAEFSPKPIELIRMGVADPRVPAAPGVRRGPDVRAALGLPPDAVVFAAFGGVTPEKRIRQAIRALSAIRAPQYRAHLVLVGERASYYDALADARACGIEDRVRLTGYVPDEDLPAYLDAADVCLCLRWPTTRETSAAWLRCLAAGKASISTDLVHNDETPSLDPRTWTTAAAAAPPAGADPAAALRAVSVSIDILDEDHSLVLAMRRLARDAELRADLGRRARAWWERSHRLEHMAADYRRVIARALEAPIPDLDGLPAHFRTNGTGRAREIIAATCGRDDLLAWD